MRREITPVIATLCMKIKRKTITHIMPGPSCGGPSEGQTQLTSCMAGGEKTQGRVPRFLYQPGRVVLQLPSETTKVHPITFIHDDVVLGTLDIGPWTTFQKAVCRISEKLGVREDAVQLRFKGKVVRAGEKPFNVGVKPWAAAAITVRVVPKPVPVWQQPKRSRCPKVAGESDDDSEDFTMAAQNKHLKENLAAHRGESGRIK